jgi:glucose-1-phosphate thymidylyltransferase
MYPFRRIAFRQGWINSEQLVALAGPLKKNVYGQNLLSLLKSLELCPVK